jgi:hypothetical protein
MELLLVNPKKKKKKEMRIYLKDVIALFLGGTYGLKLDK